MTGDDVYRFRLYIAGDARNSIDAVANLYALCRLHLPHRHEIELVDVFRHPTRALEEGVFMTPTLDKMSPAPGARVVGSLSESGIVLRAIGL